MEELDLDTNNLCTTEDAFEQFQSGAMYEEDEFITLSDIVSSPNTNQDVNEILHNDPCGELVTSSIQDAKMVNNIKISPSKQIDILDAKSQMNEPNNKDKTSTSKKRGRKKKGSFENSDVQQTQSQSDLNISTKPKRQSRKTLITADTSSELKYFEENVIDEPKGAILVTGKVNKSANKAKRKSHNSAPQKEKKEHIKKQSKQAKQTRKKIQKESLIENKNNQISNSTIEDSNIITTTTTFEIKKTKHKRGRKKRNISCQNPVSSDLEIPVKIKEIDPIIISKKENNDLKTSIPIMPLIDETNETSVENNKPNFTSKETLKNSVVSESVVNYISEEDIEDLPLSNLSKKAENELNKNDDLNTTLENKNITDLNINSKNNTSNCKKVMVKKRGRPKKISDNSPAKIDLEVDKFTRENTEKFDNINDLSTQENQTKFDCPDIISEPVISPQNEPQATEADEKINVNTESNSQSKRNSKKKIIPDFEYNVDSVVRNHTTEDTQKSHEDNENLVSEDSSRRPVRRRVLKNWNYDEGSDEDPYANVESSDDEPRRRKKGGRYYSDDDYFPGDKRQFVESESDLAVDEDDLGLHNRPQKKKKSRRSDLVISNKSPRKKGRKSDAESICTTEKTNTDSGDVDFEDCVDSSIMRGNDGQITPTKSKKDSQPWGKTNEFDNFIAKIVQGTDIKISKKSVDNIKTSLQIPVIEATEAKKSIEKSAQTVTVNTKPACVQTDTAYEIPMKDQVPLTGEQSEKACDFLSSIVQTTAELGQLMTQKSEDFITKKINTKYVTDTFKMDYCVKKSFLLFKLAKHNLVQMEEDLSKQYEEFLKENNLIQHRQEQKIIASTSKASDSDCEIVEEPVKKNVPPKAQKPAFNPKTVFLNKELSIKIAKKPTEEPPPKKKLNIKGKHSVWINDSVLVKKVKPNQSFLAQDSRNKKPPDNKITLEMVNDFFKIYERQKALFICAPFIRTEWFGRERNYMCNYFVDSTTDFPEKTVVMQNENVVAEVAFVEHDPSHVIERPKPEESVELCPETLSMLCTKIVQNCLHPKKLNTDNISKQSDINKCEHVKRHPQSLTNNAIEETHLLISDINKNIICLKPKNNASIYVKPLKTFCFKRVIELINGAYSSGGKPKGTSDNINACVAAFYDYNNIIKVKNNTSDIKQIKPLLSLCVEAIQETQKDFPRNINNIKYMPKSLTSISLLKVLTYINRNSITNNTSLVQTFYNVKSLLQLCVDVTNISLHEEKCNNLKTLLHLCVDALNISLYGNSVTNNTNSEQKQYNAKTLLQLCLDATTISLNGNSITNNTTSEQKKYYVKTLLQLCIEKTNILYFNKANNTVDGETFLEQKNPQLHSVMTLKSICRNKITELSTDWYARQYMFQEIQSDKTTLNFTINNVNTVSDDVFLDDANDDDLGDLDNENYVESSYKNEEEQRNYSDVDCGINYDDLSEDDNNWVSQVQMQELRSCLDTKLNIVIKDKMLGINETIGHDSNIQIKLEPAEYDTECVVNSSNIKIESGDDHEYLEESNNYSLINVVTKQEDIVEAQVTKEPICRQNSNSYDEKLFEAFVSSNKMIANLNVFGSTSDEIFSQSSQRVRRQYEPDFDDESQVLTDTMNLLVPHNVESNVRLMESSQEEDEEEYKKLDKKKSEKRKGLLKKNNKDLPNKGKIIQKNEIAVLPKKNKDKIRQEQKKSESSDSEPDCLKLSLKIDQEGNTEKKSNNESQKKRKEDEAEKVIQCNDVDSTELIAEDKSNPTLQNNSKDENLDEDYSENLAEERSLSPLIDSNEPIEILECEPTLPIFEELLNKKPKQKINKKEIDPSDAKSSMERDGWKCYPINQKDSKIYAHAHVQLDKLPESFVETCFKYQDVPDKIEEELEVDKPINPQSLQYTESTEVNNLSNSKPIIKEEKTEVPHTLEVIESNEKHLIQENLIEFSPIEEDLTSNVDIPPTSAQSSENHFAKEILMKDDSDTEKGDVKPEMKVEKLENMEEHTYKTRSGRTVKCKVERAELLEDELMLTADKVMNKELALLHAPVDFKNEEEEDTKDPINKSHNKNAQKHASKSQTARYRIKTEDDSSSEEEKQWFTTKEKLLKRLLKKNEDTNVDDAKRAKIVSEFIEKRGELPEPRQRARARPRCSKKSVMERRKQIKILSRELFGVETVYTKKYSPASTSKGRRNIRKVIDKKSLARSTVVANMEEFERKRRLTIRQAQLREDLGCEEGVNVVVINDELCLEYDFEEKRPVVSVHQFFTKVMKAHQYEGVKFMWDACFESVSLTSGGGAGGGCILAHCMGLGKTLQVLALLHTVLTHPQVGMRRVLVCCPLSTVLNWVDEIHKWIGPVTNHIKVFELSKLKKTYERAYQLEDWYNGGGIFIIGYELFRSLSTLDPVLDCVRPTIVNKIRTALLDPGPDIIVCDEGHLLKNDCSVLAVAMSRVVTKRRIMLTGTPMQNNLREYYCMVNFVKPNLLGSYSEYSNRFENPIMNGQHRDSREEDIKLMKARTHILHKVLEGCLQRQEASVLYPYLPKKYEYTVFISLTKCQWELYKHYLTHYINSKENKQSVLRDFHVLQKIWTHPLVLNNFLMKTRDDEKEPKMKAEKLDDDLEEAPEQAIPSAAAWWARTDHRHVLHQLDSSYKFLVVFQLLHECVELGDKVLIFSTSLYAMDALEFFLNRENKWTLGREYYRLDGSVPAEVRQKWCREFNTPQNTSTKLFLISTRAGSLGLNMTAANRVIILDTSWNPAHDIQSIFRVYRFGQKKDCYIYRLVAMGTMEQKIYERSVTKQAVSCRVVDEQQIDRHYNMAELSELYRLDEAGSGVSAGLAAGVRDAALLRVAAAGGGGGLHAVHEHDSLLRGSSESVLPEHERNAAWMQFQQEHATTHIRNFEINVPEQSVENAIVQPKTEAIEPEKENEKIPNTGEKTSKMKKKSKRKSKNKNIEVESEPQPSTSQQDLDPNVEESMIKKIMNILIKYNFHTTKGPEEISALVMNVRNVVAKASKRGLNDVDPLTASIANVLLEGENITCPEDSTKQTDKNYICKLASDDDDIMEMNLLERKRRRNTRDSDVEYLPDTRKRKSTTKTNTRKSNESVNSDNNCAVVDSSTVSTEIIANKEVLDEKPVVFSLHKPKTLSKKSSQSDLIIKITKGTCKRVKKKIKIAKKGKRKEKQPNYCDEMVENGSINECVEEKDNCHTDHFPVKATVQPTEDECIEVNDNCDADNITEKAPIQPTEDECLEVNDNFNTDNIIEKAPVLPTENESSNECIEVNDNCDTDNITEKAPVQPTENECIEVNDNYDIDNITEKAPVQPTEDECIEVNDNCDTDNVTKKAQVQPNDDECIEVNDNCDIDNINEKPPVQPNDDECIEVNDNCDTDNITEKVPVQPNDDECIEVNDNCDTDNITEKAPVQPIENESICLSDDDEPIITAPTPQNKLGISIVKKKDDAIPLHKSVLTNKNFIKLVAHTYLSGNPMLDEDAAVLAAQYSTLKALKEVQATGKNVTSGPIHDIAMKILGRDLMKRLFLANPNKYTAETILLETGDLQNRTMNDMLFENSKQGDEQQKSVVTQVNKKPEPETKTIHKRKLSIQRKGEEANEDIQKASQTTKSSQETISSEASNAKVVPVGIFKGPVALSSQQLSVEECILPDDDEVIISISPPPSPVRPPLARRNSKQLIVNTVSSKESKGNEQSTTYVQELVPIASVSVATRPPAKSTTDNIKPAKASLPNTIEIASRNKNVPTVQNISKSDVHPANVKKNTPPASDVTICLDSDEEDTPTIISEKIITKTVTSSDSRTLIVSPLVKNSETKSSEIDDKKIILVPVTSLNASSSTAVIDITKTRTPSVDQQKRRITERNAPKVTETKCKPGDIIRINESGKVEILKRIADVDSASPTQITKSKDDHRSENNVKKLYPPAVTYPPSKKNSDKPCLLKEDKRIEIPSTSKKQNDPDPLSVLKNVIHIPALKYEKNKPLKPQVEKSLQAPTAKDVTINTKLPIKSNITLQIPPNPKLPNQPNPKLQEVKPVITLKYPQQVIRNNDKQTFVKKKMIPTTLFSTIKTNDLPKPKPKPKGDASKELVIDLTEQVQVKKASVPVRTNEVIVLAGSSKDTGSNKVSSVVNESKKSTSVTVRKSMSKASPKPSTTSKPVPSTSEAKRSSPWSDSAQSKKMKTESKKKMTLIDFNLDDFDDIIELE